MIEDCHILKVKTRDIANGPGIRVSVWVAGCSHNCKGCHNPETHKWNQGKSLTQELINEILDACDKPWIQGLTLTGGDPLFPKNRDGIYQIVSQFRERFGTDKSIWLWTGYQYEEIRTLSILWFINVLVDGKYIEELKDVSLPYAGSKNQRVICINKEN